MHTPNSSAFSSKHTLYGTDKFWNDTGTQSTNTEPSTLQTNGTYVKYVGAFHSCWIWGFDQQSTSKIHGRHGHQCDSLSGQYLMCRSQNIFNFVHSGASYIRDLLQRLTSFEMGWLALKRVSGWERDHNIYIPPRPPQTTTTQCKLPECKCSICASGWMKRHHQHKLQRVMPPRVQVDCLC